MRHELQVLEDVRALLEAHRERRLEVRKELRSLMSQFGQFPGASNVHHLRLVKTDNNGSAEASA